jgi:hypothetical protein
MGREKIQGKALLMVNAQHAWQTGRKIENLLMGGFGAD